MRKETVPRVVVVDRDPTNCMLLREICQASAWEVAGCENDLKKGMSLVVRTRPDCLITDYKFDGPATGLELIARAKMLLPNLFTVILTGWDINDVAAHVTTHPPDRILKKPVPPHALMNLLESVHAQVGVIRINAV